MNAFDKPFQEMLPDAAPPRPKKRRPTPAERGYEEAIRTASVAWPILDPLQDDEPVSANPFPFEALGPILGRAAEAIAQDVQAADSLAGGSVLAAAALAAQPLANVVLPHGQLSPLSLFVMTGAYSGERKGMVDHVACFEIEETRKQQARAFANELAQHDADVAARKGTKEPEAARPTPRSITTGNATIEGISKLLKHQASLGVFSAEGGEMLGGHSLRDDRRSSGLAFFLKGWGGESMDSLRGGEGLTTLLGRRLSMHVLVQPVLLRQLLCDPLAQGQGYLARSLIAEPQTMAGTRLYRPVDPLQNPAVVAYNQRIRLLLDTPPTYWPNGDGYELKPRNLTFDAESLSLWIAFYNQIEVQQANGNELEGARPFASKAAEHAARIAGVITLVSNRDAETIGSEAMDGAIRLTAFYLVEHLRLTGSGRQQRQESDLRELAEWMQRMGPTIAKKDVLQKSPRRLGRKAARLNPLLDELTTRGYIRENAGTWEVRDV